MYDTEADKVIDTRAVPYPVSNSMVKIDILKRHIVLLLKGKDAEFRKQSVYILDNQKTGTKIIKGVRDFDVYMGKLFVLQEGKLKIYSY
jgi:hypothetical protein